MNQVDAAQRPWPPAFSETFLDDAHALFRQTGHVMIVGSLGSNRGALASALTGPGVPTARGREFPALGAEGKSYAALNHLLPHLDAQPDQSVDDVVAKAELILRRVFDVPIMSLREADLCDIGSIEVLVRLVKARHIRLVSTVGTATADDHPLTPLASRIDLRPLDANTIAQLLTSRFGATPHPTTVTMLAERSEGAYAVLKELADAGFATGQIKAISGSLVTDAAVLVENVDEAATAVADWGPRFAADHPARDLIDVTALATRLDREEARSLFGDDAISAALSLGALRASGLQLELTSRIEAMLLQRGLSPDRRAELHHRYADRLLRSAELSGAAPHLAQWSISVGQPLRRQLATQAATQANRQGRYHLALQFIASIPADELCSRLVIEQCHALSESGDESTLLTVLRSIDARTLDDADLFPYLRFASRYLPNTELFESFSAVRTATAAGDRGRAAVLDLARLIGPAYETGEEEARQSLMSLAMSGNLSPVNQALARSAIATSLRQTSRVEQAVEVATAAADVMLSSPDAAACDVEAVLEDQILCHISAADLAGAHAALTRYSQPGSEFGNLGRLGTALWSLHAFYSGDLNAAQAYVGLFLARTPVSDPHRVRGWVEALAAQIFGQAGKPDHVDELLAASHQHERNPLRQHDLERRLAQACVHDAIGEPEEALVLLQGVADEAHKHQLTLSEVDAAVLCVQIGGPVHLDQLLRAVEFIDESCGTSWIWQRFAWAIRDNSMRDLVALAVELDTDGLALFAAEVAQFTLDIARRAADMSPAERKRLVTIADPVQHRHVVRLDSDRPGRRKTD